MSDTSPPHNDSSSDLMVTTDSAKREEETALFLGMGDGDALEHSGLRARNNRPNEREQRADNKKRNDKRLDEALRNDPLINRLNAIEQELRDIESRIANSQLIINQNEHDIAFIRTLDTETLYVADGSVRDDLAAFLARHGYDDLEGKSESDIRAMLTAIEVEAIESSEREHENIERWSERHSDLRGETRGLINDDTPDQIRDVADAIAERDPEQLARDRIARLENGNSQHQESLQDGITQSQNNVGTPDFNF